MVPKIDAERPELLASRADGPSASRISLSRRSFGKWVLGSRVFGSGALGAAVASFGGPDSVEAAAASRHVELNLEGRQVRAEVVAFGGGVCWLAKKDGSMFSVRVNDVRSFRPVETPFRPVRPIELRAHLRKEFGRTYDVAAVDRTLVVADRSISATAAKLCHQVQNTFTSYFSKRSVPLEKPRFPLVTLLFHTRGEFDAYASANGSKPTSNTAGYYMPSTNRVAMYQRGKRTAGFNVRAGGRLHTPVSTSLAEATDLPPAGNALPPAGNIAQSLNSDVRDTLIHETVHQIAFNTGLHSRTGDDPTWVVEGLATMFEPDAIRRFVADRSPARRVNPERMAWFERRVRPRWTRGRLAEIITSDRMFRTAALDAYAQAWSLTFFLVETRSAQYATFLRGMAKRRALGKLSEDQRVADFQAAFGRDLALLEAKWMRYQSKLAGT